jgi:hypothetical protein
MKHRLLITLAIAALACAAVATSAVAAKGGKGPAFQFRGDVVSASSTSVTITVEGGNHAALRAMLGQTQNQTFTVGDGTEVLVWSNGIPKVGSTDDLHQGDWVTVDLHAKRGSSLSDIEGTAAGRVADRGSNPAKADKPLYLYAGTVDGPQSGGHIALHVKGGNARGLRTLIGQSRDQTFSYGDDTIFLLWQHGVPSVIDPSKLVAGDRITIRIRADKGSSLSQVESTSAVHVGDHEPAGAKDNS